jgi:5'-nucleotidase
MNDTHSHLEPNETELKFDGVKTWADLGGFAKVASKVKKVRQEKPDSILLHAGDAVQGTAYFTKYNGRPEYEMLGMLGVDAFELGNHEFDRGQDFLLNILVFLL